MGTKRNPGQFDCHAKAHQDEPLFTLLGRDPAAGVLVRMWALSRHRAIELGMRPREDAEKVTEALKCADAMDAFCKAIGRQPYNGAGNLLAVTETMKQHPEGYEHPCMCDLCKSYATEGHAVRPIPGMSPQPNHFDPNDGKGGL